MSKTYQICTRCVMDTSASDITFNDKGECNYCTNYLRQMASMAHQNSPDSNRLNKLIQNIKNSSTGKQYDCIVGVSGGVDSSYALYIAVKSGLKPLAVHLDNGWNSELAVANIENLVKILNVDLYTHVIDWEENKSLQRAFFKANVVDIELLMDNAMLALNYEMAAKYNVKYILAGTNTATEGIAIPPSWNHYKKDAQNIKNINKKFGTQPIKTHPLISTLKYLYMELVKGIKWVSFLDYVPYQKQDAIRILQEEVNYKPYPYKHYESVFTRFYQGYILPQKFGVDKRRIHLSALVASGEMNREYALTHFEKIPYNSIDDMNSDLAYVCKKLGFTQDELKKYMAETPVPHEFYGSEKWLWELALKIRSKLRYSRRV